MKRTLKPDGVFAMYNFYRQGWVVGRLAKMAEEVFGAEAAGASRCRTRDSIQPGDTPARPHHLPAGRQRLQAPGGDPRDASRRATTFWLNSDAGAMNEAVNALPATAAPAGEGWHRSAPATRVDLAGIDLLPSDDWPQLYLRERRDPLGADRPGHAGRSRCCRSLILLGLRAAAARVRPQPADVLPRRRLHAAGDQGRGAHGAALRLDLDRQLDRLLRDPGDDPVRNLFVLAVKPQNAAALLRAAGRRRCWSTRWCR